MKRLPSVTMTRTFAAGLMMIVGIALHAREMRADERGAARPTQSGQAKAAGCSPATWRAELDLNNVRTRIETGGNKWMDRSGISRAAYEVPKTEDRSGAHAIFAGGLWMGGVSPDNQLKLAAVMFRTGNDFWPGPLTNTGDASVEPQTCLDYDKSWTTYRVWVELHEKYFLCQDDPNCNIDEEFPDGYSIPPVFFDWPAIGDVGAGQDLYIAPFADFDGDGDYDPTMGDYPGYDLRGSVEDCKNRFREDPVSLFGDMNIWWVFNDKGDVHTESGGQPIGMEIRAQAFAFSTNDEVNNMTFYNYVLINQGTQTLLNTYFGQWVDPDLGFSDDDYVGCDVQRGLGYCYNGRDPDPDGQMPGYGAQPPAIGVDFFEGPFVDYDGIDNPLTQNCDSAFALNGIPYAGIGIGYSDDVVDNERFGMRAFMFHNRTLQATGDPQISQHYYNYLRSRWKDNSRCVYGGNGYFTHPQANPNQPALYMFPGDSDPVGWGTDCAIAGDFWTEESVQDNPPFDRRFIQSAGPFTLEPGAYNNITVGVVWARAASGGPYQSVEAVRLADDKAQALFDNCFKLLDGPDAPDLTIRELDRELIIYITNPENSNNFNEQYVELDAIIPPTDIDGNPYDREYRFQGYKLYQVKDATVDVSQLDDVTVSRLVFQCDVRDNVGQIVNYIQDQQINLPVPTEMVNGANEGIRHSVRITQDRFAQGDPRLVNFKTYHFICIAYGYNNFENYNPVTNAGQPFPYLAGRKAAAGSIRSYSGIPHKPAPGNGGTIQNSQYGDQFEITRLEGQGNGALVLDITRNTENAVMGGSPWRANEIAYRKGLGPVDVMVVDPLRVPEARFEIWFADSLDQPTLDDAHWYMVRLDSDPSRQDTISSDRTIRVENEQIIPDWGISVTIGQVFYEGTGSSTFTRPAGEGSITFADPSKAWLTGIPDSDGQNVLNWIRSGTAEDAENEYNDRLGKDDDKLYARILGGTWAPWPVVGEADFQPASPSVGTTYNQLARFDEITSTLVVITPDKDKWTRSAVLEQESNPNLALGGAAKLALRASPSVDKNGRSVGQAGVNESEATRGGTQPNGMGWFPGYAIDLETGERLNIAFGENSYWGGPGGRDMLWNPSDTIQTFLGQPIMGGGHWIYVFKNERRAAAADNRMPMYDEGQFIYTNLMQNTTASRTRVYRGVNWVGSALRVTGRQLLETEVRIRLNVEKAYRPYRQPFAGYEPAIAPERNNGLPLYTFSTSGLAVQTNVAEVANEMLDIINVVPNPYYAFSGYESSRLDNRIRFINLPQECTISIYNVSGTLVRKYRKDNELTYLDWDLKNANNIPIAGGVYICHVEVPGVGEKVLKWFGVMRPLDLQNF